MLSFTLILLQMYCFFQKTSTTIIKANLFYDWLAFIGKLANILVLQYSTFRV